MTLDLKHSPPPMATPEIALSWRRSEMAGLSPDDTIAVACEFDPSSRLVGAAEPVLKHLGGVLDGMPAGGLLADRSATIVGRYFGDSGLAVATEKVGGQLGIVFDEERTGTNAIATAHEIRSPVMVRASEHFLGCMRGFSCYGAPIINPVSQRLEGVIDIMSGVDADERWLQAILDRTVREIQQRLMIDYDPDVLASLASFNALSRRTDDAVILFGRDFVLHNRQTIDILGSVGIDPLDSLAFEFRGRSGTAEVELAPGCLYTVDSVQVAGEGYSLLRIHDEQLPRVMIPRGDPRQRSETGRRDDKIAALAGATENVMIVGERGSGRSAAARRVAPDAEMLDGATVTPQMIATAPGGLLVIEHVHLLSPGAAQALADRACDGSTRVVMTTTAAPARDDPAAHLGSLCPEWLELRALRERLTELPTIASDLLDSMTHDGSSGLRLSAAAVDLLRTHDWPGNLAELANVLDYARTQRQEGDIVVADLPERYQRGAQTRPGLTPMEQTERDLIVRTLATFAGNKVHTAKHLGISRSKLYDRLKYFRIS